MIFINSLPEEEDNLNKNMQKSISEVEETEVDDQNAENPFAGERLPVKRGYTQYVNNKDCRDLEELPLIDWSVQVPVDTFKYDTVIADCTAYINHSYSYISIFNEERMFRIAKINDETYGMGMSSKQIEDWEKDYIKIDDDGGTSGKLIVNGYAVNYYEVVSPEGLVRIYIIHNPNSNQSVGALLTTTVQNDNDFIADMEYVLSTFRFDHSKTRKAEVGEHEFWLENTDEERILKLTFDRDLGHEYNTTSHPTYSILSDKVNNAMSHNQFIYFPNEEQMTYYFTSQEPNAQYKLTYPVTKSPDDPEKDYIFYTRIEKESSYDDIYGMLYEWDSPTKVHNYDATYLTSYLNYSYEESATYDPEHFEDRDRYCVIDLGENTDYQLTGYLLYSGFIASLNDVDYCQILDGLNTFEITY